MSVSASLVPHSTQPVGSASTPKEELAGLLYERVNANKAFLH